MPAKVPAALDGGWRFARAAGIEALLTFDGAHQLYWSETLEPTTPGQGQLKLDVPGRGTAFVAMDTDGSILVARGNNDVAAPDLLRLRGAVGGLHRDRNDRFPER